jgi:hypothetical protein
MADGNPLHQHRAAASGLVPALRVTTLPLLPYEKQLIEHLGLDTEEYIAYKKQLLWQSFERGPDYQHIPEIYAILPAAGPAAAAFLGGAAKSATLTAVAINVAVGVVLSAVSYLLTPKPRSVNVRNRQLENIVGRDRYAPTFGFQSGQDLSRYGEAIPIVFTKQVQRANGSYTGGLMIGPKLVWSRLFSWGPYQTADLVFLVGQGRMSRGPYSTPADIAADRAGIYFGQMPLDALLDSEYRWFYYQGGEPESNGIGYKDDSRLRGSHNRYGTYGPDIGQPDNAFFAPSFAGGDSEAFSHSYSPSSQLRFGVFNSIPNGTPLRLNWQVVSRLDIFGLGAKREATTKRVQISGNFRMRGTGRNYPRFIGILSYTKKGAANAVTTAVRQNNGQLITGVGKGDRITIRFSGDRLDEAVYVSRDVYSQNRIDNSIRKRGITNDEIISTIAGELEQYDDLLQLGNRFVVGDCYFRVVGRTPADEKYDRNATQEFDVSLECEDIFTNTVNGTGTIGICNREFVINKIPLPESTENGPDYDIGQAWFPITMAEFASFQNIRECDFTEIGIRSQVWLRFNGLTNFASIPGPELLAEYDKDDIQVTGGSIQAYSSRSSFFALEVRSANAGPTQPWERLSQYPFCVRGNAPIDQFNFIRIRQPRNTSGAPQQFEYRLRPINSGELVQIIKRDSECLRLSAVGTVFVSTPVVTSYGTFTTYTRGFIEKIADQAASPEMTSRGRQIAASNTRNQPGVTLVRAIVDGRDATAREISNGITKTINKDPDRDATENPFGNIPWSGTPEGGVYKFTASDISKFFVSISNSGGTKRLNLEMSLQSYKENGPYNSNREWFWQLIYIKPVDIEESGIDWKDGEQFEITKTLIDGRPIKYIFRYNATKLVTAAIVEAERTFETNTAISEVSHYGGLVTRSCDNAAEHEIVYINESITPKNKPGFDGCAMAGIKIRSSRNFNQLEQLRLYQKNGIQVTTLRLPPAGGGILTTTESSNIFTDLVNFLLTNKQAGLGTLISDDLVDQNAMATTALFLEANELYYDDVITEPTNIRDFVASIAPSLLCNMVMRNGKFSIEPALPFKRNGKLEDQNGLADVSIKAIFTDGNIIEDSFEMRYLNLEERKPMKVALRYRIEHPNRFPEERTVVVSYNNNPSWSNAPIEEFSYTHITSQEHAEIAAKYFLSVRRNITHTVSFKTTPYGLSLAPGDYIRVVTEANIYDPTTNNGTILNDGPNGTIISVEPLADGTYDVYLWERRTSDVEETILVVQNGTAFNRSGAIFALRNNTTAEQAYVVESLQLDEDGLVQIVASHFPVTGNNSVIAEEITGRAGAIFTVETSA